MEKRNDTGRESLHLCQEEAGSPPGKLRSGYQHPHPLLFPQSRSSTMIIQQLSPLPHPLPHPHPLFPHRHSRMMIHRILQQELFPQESPQPLLQPLSQPQLLLHPQPFLSSPHPQFVAAKSLMLNPPEFLYIYIICKVRKCVTLRKNQKILPGVE